jgi:hypothetical protein
LKVDEATYRRVVRPIEDAVAPIERRLTVVVGRVSGRPMYRRGVCRFEVCVEPERLDEYCAAVGCDADNARFHNVRLVPVPGVRRPFVRRRRHAR